MQQCSSRSTQSARDVGRMALGSSTGFKALVPLRLLAAVGTASPASRLRYSDTPWALSLFGLS